MAATGILETNALEINGQLVNFGADIDLSDVDGSGNSAATSAGFKELLAKFNGGLDGVTVTGQTTAEADTVGTGLLDASNTLTITSNNPDGAEAVTFTSSSSLEDLVSQINANMSSVSATINDAGRIVLENSTGGNIAITDTGTGDANAGFGTTTSFNGSLVFTADDGSGVSIAAGSEDGDGETVQENLDRAGLMLSSGTGVVLGSSFTATTVDDSFEANALSINGVTIGTTDTDSFKGKLDAINAVTSQTGVTASAAMEVTIEVLDSTGGLSINGATASTGTSLNALATALNAADTGLRAEIVGDGTGTTGTLVLKGELETASIAAAATGDYELDGAELNTAGNQQVYGGIKLNSDNGTAISVDLSPTATAANYSVKETNAAPSSGQSVEGIDISTAAGAQNAIGSIDNALETINDARADLGAINNRLDFTINNLSSISQAASASRSRIEDADFAAESAALSRAQVLQQAGTAMLAQANAQPQQVLSLLQ
ncbi:MAG: flagellin [Motiliproteus sp.]|nr:flagellin [Motiliproteus sp.]MCW9051994.1 flagellin [Motiliproteus sp.]